MRSSSPFRLPIFCVLLQVLSLGCMVRVPPPDRLLPNAPAALARLESSRACGIALQVGGTLDLRTPKSRTRGLFMLYAVPPDKLRLDLFSAFGTLLLTFTAESGHFVLTDRHHARTVVGHTTSCLLGQLLGIELPLPVLIDLLRGRAPQLSAPLSPRALWQPEGYYLLQAEARGGVETLRLAPPPKERTKSWQVQSMQLLGTTRHVAGKLVYSALFDQYEPGEASTVSSDPDGLEPPLPPSGPPCTVEVPRRLEITLPARGTNLRMRYTSVVWNPPLSAGLFAQPPLPNTVVEQPRCAQENSTAPESPPE